MNLENSLELKKIEKRKFDYVILMDILEHLRNPDELLKNIVKLYKIKEGVIISIPNVANISIRVNLLMGKFQYTDFGLLDKTHVKFFTFESAKNLIISSGLKIQSIDYTTNLGLVNFIGRLLRHLPIEFQYLLTQIFPKLLAGQFVFICSA
jgi:2-polyprenyl-3-methyl-5-hydroxy-6-metoxy-1,4-benzoquinol methylase